MPTMSYTESSSDDLDSLPESYFYVAKEDAAHSEKILAIADMIIAILVYERGELNAKDLDKRLRELENVIPDLRERVKNLPRPNDSEYFKSLIAILKKEQQSIVRDRSPVRNDFNRLYGT